jgi:hypothetical protein
VTASAFTHNSPLSTHHMRLPLPLGPIWLPRDRAGVAELVDAADLGSAAHGVWVRVPALASRCGPSTSECRGLQCRKLVFAPCRSFLSHSSEDRPVSTLLRPSIGLSAGLSTGRQRGFAGVFAEVFPPLSSYLDDIQPRAWKPLEDGVDGRNLIDRCAQLGCWPCSRPPCSVPISGLLPGGAPARPARRA